MLLINCQNLLGSTNLADLIKLIAATIAITTAFFTAASAYLGHRRYKQEHKLNREKFFHERIKWAESINHEIEKKLIAIRIKKYPKVLEGLKTLSKHKDELKYSDFESVANILHESIYNETSLSMSAETRKIATDLRDACKQSIEKIDHNLVNTLRYSLVANFSRDINTNDPKWVPNVEDYFVLHARRLENLYSYFDDSHKPQKPFGLVILDGDGTLTDLDNPILEFSKVIGCFDEISLLVNQYLSDTISYQELVEKENEIFLKQGRKYAQEKNHEKLDKELFNEIIDMIIAQRTHFQDKSIVNSLVKKGCKVILVSSGWDIIANKIANELGGLKSVHANSVKFSNNEFRGTDTKIKVSGSKILEVEKLIKKHKTSINKVAYVGDSKFDFPIMKWITISGGMAFYLKGKEKLNPPKDIIQINELSDLLHYMK
jgi:HAD superfamily phosphoserine phosphatase-like hydrolase